MSFSLQEGTVFGGRYRIVRCIAKGGMGAVYEVVHLETDRLRALKVMLPQMLHNVELKERFKREARVASKIGSDFIVDVFDAGIDEATESPFLVMELLKGEELGRRLARVGPLAPVDVVTWLYQAALALDKAHKASIVHRDLKPENLFLTEVEHGEPRIKILDFGIAKELNGQGTEANATRSLGTPLYMSPEQFRGGKISPAVDLYALGMMAYTLLVGESYWERESLNAGSVFAFALIAMEGAKELPTERAAVRKGVRLPEAFNQWFFRATHPDPAQRFPSATATISALSEALGLGPITLTASSIALPAAVMPSMLSRAPSAAIPAASAEVSRPNATGAAVTSDTSVPVPKNRGPVVTVALLAGALVIAGGTLIALKATRGSAPAGTATATAISATAPIASAAPPASAPIETASAKAAPPPAPTASEIEAVKPATTAQAKAPGTVHKPGTASPRPTAKPTGTEPEYTRD